MKRFLACFLLIAITSPAHSALYTSAYGTVTGGSMTDTGPTQGDHPLASISGIGLSSSVAASAWATYGGLKVYATGEATTLTQDSTGQTSVPVGLAYAAATAQSTDFFTLWHPELNGTKGLLTASYASDAFLMAETLFDANYESVRTRHGFDATLLGTGVAGRVVTSSMVWAGMNIGGAYNGKTTTDYYGTSYDDSSFYDHQLTIEFIWGNPILSAMSMWVDGTVPGNHSYQQPTYGRFLADAWHSAYWGGISSVFTNGVEITDYILTSDSGTDYRKSFIPQTSVSVPEPGSVVLFALGLFGLAARFKKL